MLVDYENIEDRELEDWMMDVPSGTKVLITSRYKEVRSARYIQLDGLNDVDALTFTRAFGKDMGVKRVADVSDEQLLPLVHVTDGNPKAIEMSVGHVKMGDSLEEIVDALHEARENTNDIFTYLFSHAWERLNIDARYLLQALAFFGEWVTKEALGAVAGLKGFHLDKARDDLVKLSLLDVLDVSNVSPPYYSAHTLTHVFAASQLAKSPEWEQEARQRWVEWYLEFTKQYGGLDWSEWARHYDKITHEWPNLQLLFRWCAESDDQGYEHLLALWDRDHLLNYSDICGHWEERLIWLEWILQQASLKVDQQEVQVLMMQGIAWTYAVRGRSGDLDTVEELLTRAWEMRQYATRDVQRDIANNFAVLYRRQNRFTEALEWLQIEQDLVVSDTLDQQKRLRELIPVPYYRGQIYSALEQYGRAYEQFLLMMEYGEESGWQRAVIYAQNCLADIATKNA